MQHNKTGPIEAFAKLSGVFFPPFSTSLRARSRKLFSVCFELRPLRDKKLLKKPPATSFAKTSIEHFFFRWGGVLILLLVAAGLFEYETAIHERHLHRLEERKTALLAAKTEARQNQTRLRSILICQDDPEWVEYLLMTKLGLIPVGSKKVKFND